MQQPITLIGDGVETPGNARAMIAAAAMFGAECLFCDRSGLVERWRRGGEAETLRLIGADGLRADFAPIAALENLPGTMDVYGARLPAGGRPALVAGNERRGVATDILSMASIAIQIPMFGRSVNTLNVAAASAVALYYLSRGGGAGIQHSTNPERRRPEVLLIGGADHVELGSAIRSAAAFGWERLLVEDRGGVWFGAERRVQSEGRAAARRHRNPVRLLRATPDHTYAFPEVCVLSTRAGGVPLHRVNLARGPRLALVIPDESTVDVACERWERLGGRVTLVRLPLAGEANPYHFRLIAGIVLAEAARQVGRRPRPAMPGLPRRAPVYERSVRLMEAEAAELVYAEELEAY